MKFLTADEAEVLLKETYVQELREFPDAFDKFIPKSAPPNQFIEVLTAIKQLTGHKPSQDFEQMLQRWDFTNLNIAAFDFGHKGTYAERLIENNRTDKVMSWWEDAFDERPPTWLYIAQGDPFVLLLDVANDNVLAYIADEGANTSKKIANTLSKCLRMLVTVNVYDARVVGQPLTVHDIQAVLGEDCDSVFWGDQIRHWTEVNSQT